MIVRYVFENQRINNFTSSYIDIIFGRSDEPIIDTYNGASTTLPTIIYRMNYSNKTIIDTDEAYNVVMDNPQIREFIKEGKNFDVLESTSADFSAYNSPSWSFEWSWAKNSFEESSNMAFIRIDSISGEVLEVRIEMAE